MICFARCSRCHRSLSVEEIREYASHKLSREWWEWQLSGLCKDCSMPDIEEEVKEDGYRDDAD